MSRFNSQTVGTKTHNLAGGEAFQESPKLEIASTLLTSFVEDKYYRSADQTMVRLRTLIDTLPDKKFAAQAAIYARTKYGMRSISHVVAREMARVQGQHWTRPFFDKVIYRPDDMTEILSLYWSTNDGNKAIPNALKEGFASAFSRFDAYQLAKYRGEGKDVSLVDVVNLVRPKPTDKNRTALKQLMDGSLRSAETWETKLTQAGQQAETDDQKEELKGKAWADLLKEKKLGYFALLRNLRNISQQSPEVLDLALEQLVDEQAIRKSLVLPFRYLTAMDEISDRRIVKALNKAIEISLVNVPKFGGKTLVALDGSGSMGGKPLQIGSLFAAILYKANDALFMTFGTSARFVTINPDDSVATIAECMQAAADNGGTNFHDIFDRATQKFDRIFILSDMQGWMGYDSPTREFANYKRRTGADPKVFSFDLAGYGTLQFPERNVLCLAGFSDKTMDMLQKLDEDPNSLVKEIEAVVL